MVPIELCYVFSLQIYFAHGIEVESGLGVCKNTRGQPRCCTNYQQKQKHCVPCEVGTYGDNCSGGPCPYGSYGFGCQSKCNCTIDQFCDRRTGCVNKTSNESKTDGDWTIAEKILFSVLGVLVGVGSIRTIIHVCKRIKSQIAKRYIDTMFLAQPYDQPVYERESELYITR